MTSHGLSRRSVLTMAPLGALGVALAVSNAPQAKAEELSTYWIQRDLIYFGFLPIGSDDGIYGAQTTEAVRWMQYRAGSKRTASLDQKPSRLCSTGFCMFKRESLGVKPTAMQVRILSQRPLKCRLTTVYLRPESVTTPLSKS